jgi:tRNA-2-methylthio-N6-dimethylallyladenosine synthase
VYRRVYVRTYGCQMNEYDSALMLQVLEEAGYLAAESAEEADLVILNTCSVRQKAEEKVYSDLGRLKALKRNGAGPRIAVAGCVARHRAEQILAAAPFVDLVFGPDAIPNLPQLMERVETGADPVLATGIPDRDQTPFLALSRVAPRQVSAFVTVMRGCDRFCTYCIVPYVRGREVSRPSDAVLAEVAGLVGRGVREVTLLGQNVNSYGRGHAGEPDFPTLLDRVDAVPGLDRLRFVTSHPHDCTPALMERFASLERLCEYFHLPLQAGSDAVLARMNRRYTAADYLEKVDYLRRIAPRVHLSSDLIVGFPGETEEDFARTMEMLERVRFDSLFSFKYSPREGTRAADLPDDVPEEVKLRRLHELQARQDELSFQSLQGFQDRTVEVLVEGTSKRDQHEWMGRTRSNVVVNLAEPQGSPAVDLLGRLVDVRIERIHRHSLHGVMVGSPR